MDRKLVKNECYKNKKVTVMGLGLFGGGVGATKFLVSQGADITVTDLKSADGLSASLKLLNGLPVKFRLGKHYEEDFSNIDLLIVNPAVSNDSRFLQIARDNDVCIDTELNIFFKLCPAPVIGVTGSNGKSTTTTLLGKMLKEGKIKTWIGGNIGVSLLEYLGEIKPNDVVVIEISSFQLEYLSRIEISPHISIVTNIAPNHLDRHKTLENYIDAKKAIIHYQKEDDYVILNYDDPILRKWESEIKSSVLWFSTMKEMEQGAFLNKNEIVFNHNSKSTVIPCSKKIKIKGIHNLQNIMAASCAAIVMHADVEAINNVITNFSGLEHRLEYVCSINGVQYYNDSKATTPEAAIAGIRAFDSLCESDQYQAGNLVRGGQRDHPFSPPLKGGDIGEVVLIAGGYNKKVSLHQFAQECVKNTKYVILIGETAKNIQELIQNMKGEKAQPEVYVATSLDESVRKASEVAEAGDVVLLSPACASYDMFTNYEERGKKFKELVAQLDICNPAS
ncbi:MAG: UDP-N-acetylmuramoylalanine/D-glutamate ligase [Candidatus Scalindua rubra]|uniref:UDP-N-acetylmuramoylalanine--D-glutamate ligase n=1 Tax=Candidatus Scalindua rubra TaxID=1872076 RepID=A0A1E3XGI5_9BACT|nr:MAG: UDP-N-acetylmuramoylalanine/D-glutamate ligase [Candidatus Scalindua rubra]